MRAYGIGSAQGHLAPHFISLQLYETVFVSCKLHSCEMQDYPVFNGHLFHSSCVHLTTERQLYFSPIPCHFTNKPSFMCTKVP
jgi:hypothetical protein